MRFDHVFCSLLFTESIRQARKLDFRHSDNINYFFDFVRNDAGLPEVMSSSSPPGPTPEDF